MEAILTEGGLKVNAKTCRFRLTVNRVVGIIKSVQIIQFQYD